MAYTFKFETGKPHEDPVDIEVWIFVFRSEYLEDYFRAEYLEDY